MLGSQSHQANPYCPISTQIPSIYPPWRTRAQPTGGKWGSFPLYQMLEQVPDHEPQHSPLPTPLHLLAKSTWDSSSGLSLAIWSTLGQKCQNIWRPSFNDSQSRLIHALDSLPLLWDISEADSCHLLEVPDGITPQ